MSSAKKSAPPKAAGSKASDSMLLTRRPAVGEAGLLAHPPLSDPASTSQMKESPEPLWPPKGKIAPGGLA